MLPLNGVKQSFHMSIIFAPDEIVQGHDAIGREGRQSPGSEETSCFSDSCADPSGRRKVAVRQFADSGCGDAGSSKVTRGHTTVNVYPHDAENSTTESDITGSSEEDLDDSVEDANYHPDNDSDSSSSECFDVSLHGHTGTGSEVFLTEQEELHQTARSAATLTKARRKGQSRKERALAKVLKDQGKEYFNRKGELKVRKTMKPSTCKDGCSLKIAEESRRLIFEHFYNLSHEAQDQYICGCMEENDVKRRRITVDADHAPKRNITRTFFFNLDSSKIVVCRQFFLETLAIGASRIRTLSKKKATSAANIAQRDQRGRHPNQRCITEESRAKIRQHIKKFPVFRSHYNREKNDKLFLSPDLNRHKMYKLYVEECHRNKTAPLKEWVYYDEFLKNFGHIKFAQLKVDTCNACDQFKAKGDAFSAEHRQHLDEAAEVYSKKRADKQRCKTDDGYLMLSFDLEKCLPTPNLTCSEAFYKRLL